MSEEIIKHNSEVIGLLQNVIKENRQKLNEVLAAYEVELESNLQKGKLIKDLQEKLEKEYNDKTQLLIHLISFKKYITDFTVVKDCERVINYYLHDMKDS